MFFLTYISAVSDNILCICIQEPLLILKKIVALLHTLSAYNSLLVHYKVYSPDHREWLYTSWRYGEAYENLNIDPALCRKNPVKNKLVIPICQPLLLGENYTEIKTWQLKFPLKTSSDMFWKKTSYETEHLSPPFDNKSWYQKRIG